MQISRKFVREELTQTARDMEERMKKFFPDLVQEPGLMNLITLLYFHEMKFEPIGAQTPARDRIIVTLAEVFPYIFATLAQSGYFPWEQAPALLSGVLRMCRESSTYLMAHPGVDGMCRDTETALHYANGFAMSGLVAKEEFRVYLLAGSLKDPGALQALQTAAKFKLDNLTAVILNLELMDRADLIHQWFVLGWHIEEVDLSQLSSLAEGFARVSRVRGKPSVILC